MAIPYIKFYPEFWALLNNLKAKEQASILDAVKHYQMFEEWPEISKKFEENKNFLMVFSKIQEKVILDTEKYLEKSNKARESVLSRWNKKEKGYERITNEEETNNGSNTDEILFILTINNKQLTIKPENFPLTFLLADLMKANNPNVKLPANLKAWAKEEDRLVRIDKRPVEEALQVLKWCQADGFWKSNILSIPKFREKYDTLKLQMQNKRGAGAKSSALPSPDGKYKV
ncbi:hypothetical protein Emin_0975 [Elusimicrobium minutum Pei191]|uniref:Uncharacterized protein n=1 Tax=Elusimicrobium minutum (strain Pei191) TaxID=445932 RepID=B2KDD2_ELUMP|nr:hypothetical protein [Elusimicrobium minutum]ACC98528.1 hypothetical protein Emin_0975 [Elusimicrobium minutum Pei191]